MEKRGKLIAAIVSFVAVVSGVYSYSRAAGQTLSSNPKQTVNQSAELNGREPGIDKIIKDFIKREKVPESSRRCFEAGVSLALPEYALKKQKKGDLLQAVEKFKCSVKIHPTPEGFSLLGNCYFILGQYEIALKNYENGYGLYKKEDGRAGEAATLNSIGLVYKAQWQFSKAVDYYEKSIKISTEIGDLGGEGRSLSNIGKVYEGWGEYTKAIEYFKNSLKIFEEIGAADQIKIIRAYIEAIEKK